MAGPKEVTVGGTTYEAVQDWEREWPQRIIMAVEVIPNQWDEHSFAEKISLSCGHSCVRTYSTQGSLENEIGEFKGCRHCWEDQQGAGRGKAA